MEFDELAENLRKGTGLSRAKAAAGLGKLKDKRASGILIEALKDPIRG